MSNELKVEIVPGDTAPRYGADIVAELDAEKAIITEQGTAKGLPIVDFVMVGHDGKKYLMVLNGRIINALSATLRGINKRNHGKEEP